MIFGGCVCNYLFWRLAAFLVVVIYSPQLLDGWLRWASLVGRRHVLEPTSLESNRRRTSANSCRWAALLLQTNKINAKQKPKSLAQLWTFQLAQVFYVTAKRLFINIMEKNNSKMAGKRVEVEENEAVNRKENQHDSPQTNLNELGRRRKRQIYYTIFFCMFMMQRTGVLFFASLLFVNTKYIPAPHLLFSL